MAIFGKLLKFMFSVFPDPFGRVAKFVPVPGDGEKLAGTFKIKSSPYLLRNKKHVISLYKVAKYIK